MQPCALAVIIPEHTIVSAGPSVRLRHLLSAIWRRKPHIQHGVAAFPLLSSRGPAFFQGHPSASTPRSDEEDSAIAAGTAEGRDAPNIQANPAETRRSDTVSVEDWRGKTGCNLQCAHGVDPAHVDSAHELWLTR